MSDIWTCLIRIKSETGLRSHMIDRPSFTLGRTQDSDVPILAPSVSRVHLLVELRDQQIWVTDKNSANGSLRNTTPLVPGVATLLMDGDVVRLGSEPEEFYFLALPLPVELQDKEIRKDSLKDSMKELAAQFEAQSKEKVEKEMRRARSESEQIIAEAKKRAEISKTQDGMELQTRKQTLEAELARIKQDAMEELTRDRLKAKREADMMIADAQRTIQKDFSEAAVKIDTQLSEAHTRSVELFTTAEAKAQAALDEARDEAISVRNTASDEARVIHRESTKKGEEMLAEMRSKYAREMAEQKTQALETARAEARRENELFIANTAKAREELELNREKIEKLNTQISTASKELSELEGSKKSVADESAKLRSENEKLIDELKKVEELEGRRLRAETELANANRSFQERSSSLDREIKEMRDKRLLDLDGQKRSQETDMATARVKALEDIKKQIEREEKKYEETKRLRALDLAQMLNASLIPQLKGWLDQPESAAALMKASVEKTAADCLLNASTALSAITVDDGTPAATIEQRDKKTKKYVWAAVATAAIIGAFYRVEIRKMVDDSQKTSLSSKMMEDRRIQSIYAPDQDGDYRQTYTDNVLYMKGYFDLKSDSKTIEAWTLKLNDLNIIHPMKLSEEDVVKFVAKETTLVQRLGVLRGSIDKVYLAEGLERMRKAETEDVAEIVTILKSDENYRKIRDLERDFLAEQAKKQAK